MKAVTTSLFLPLILLITNACGISNGITVQDAWARPGFRGDNSAVYLTISNSSEQSDELIVATSDVAGAAEIHLTKMDAAGTMTMERQDRVVIPAKDSLELAPGGLHIMLVKLGKDLSVGDSFPLTLELQRAGDITIEVEVKRPD